MAATAKVSFCWQPQAEHTYNRIARNAALDLDEIRLHGKVITLTCRDFGLLIHITNQVFQPLAGFIKKIVITNEED
jgi:hypothetical protein